MAHGTCAACGNEGNLKRGWCSRCYQRWRAHGDPLWEPLQRDPSQYDSTGHRLHEKVCPGCGEKCRLRIDQTHCSTSCALTGKRRPGRGRWGEGNPNWGGEQVGYWGNHQRVYRARGKADYCVNGCEAKIYEWASLVDDPQGEWDFQPMCRSCHRKFDSERDRQRPGYQGANSRKLTADIVREARKLRADGATYAALAVRYGVHADSISQAVRGINWGWVK